jgi:hypothetical protein
MSGTDIANEGVLRGVAKLLGLPDVAALSDVKPSGLMRLTQRELLDVAKLLGLSKVSRLKKEALLARVWDVLAKSVGVDAGVTVTAQAVTTPVAARSVAEGSNGRAGSSAKGANGEKTSNGARAASSGSAPDPVAHAARTLPPPTPSPQDMRESHPGAAHKFDVGEGAEPDLAALRAESEASIPWGYGRDRITAMPVDPDRLYAYWEVTDDAIARARGGLGAGGEGAYLCLRLYDITGRIFDGTNAHATWDFGIDRSQRQFFFQVGKPSSEAVVEIGLKSHEGFFVKVARSGRVTFPRRSPNAGGEPEWMTVRVSTGQVEGAFGGGGAGGGAAAAGGTGPAPGSWMPGGAAGVIPDGVHFSEGFADLRRLMWGGRSEESFPTQYLRWEEIAETEIDAEVIRSWTWQSGDLQTDSWTSGPFSYPVAVPVPVQETYGGPARVFRSGSRTHVVWGPWQVVIKGIGAHAEREELGRWEIFRSWSATGWKVIRTPGEGANVIAMGGSGGRLGASEQRLGGASERFRLGASELRLGGASERSFIGSSELRLGGSSERSFLGSSELRLGGSSEVRMGGGSEGRLGGGSEGRLGGGGSERRLGGDNERRLGGDNEDGLGAKPVIADDVGWPVVAKSSANE